MSKLRYPAMAEHIGVSQRTLKAWVSNRLVPYFKIRRTVLFDPVAVEAALKKFERKAA